MNIENGEVAADVDVESTDQTTLPATGETTEEIPSGTTEPTDGDEDADVNAESNNGKIDATRVKEIVQKRVEKVRAKTREDVQASADAEIEFWKNKAQGQKQETVIVSVPAEPKMTDYASNPTQYEKDLKKWVELKTKSEDYTKNIQAQYGARCNEFRKDKADFDKSVQFFNAVTVSPSLLSSILESDQGPALSYYLSKNFKEFDRINKLSPISVAKEIGKLELRLTGQVAEPKPVEKKTVVPKPTKPVSGSAPQSQDPAKLVQTEEGRLKFLETRKKVHRQGSINR